MRIYPERQPKSTETEQYDNLKARQQQFNLNKFRFVLPCK